MPIIDSLFLELGVDTSKFSADQQRALRKIQEFETKTKRAAGNARSGIKTVGEAFRDLASESRLGASANHLDNLATKFKNLGISMSASGGAGVGFGAMSKGLGMLLSPASLGIAAIGMLGKGVWDLNRDMSAINATLARNAELTGMSATNLWAMSMAAKTVGADPAAVQAGIVGLQTALAGMSIGAGDASAQLVGMARLRRYGARFNPGGFGQGANEESLFNAVNAYYKQHGRAATMALVTGYGLMSADQASLAMSPGGWQEYQKAQAQARAMSTGGGFEGVVRKSLASQLGLGEKDIAAAITAESAYGGVQGGMQTVIGLLTNIYGVLNAILGYISSLFGGDKGGIKDLFAGSDAATIGNILGTSLPKSASDRMAMGKKILMGFGMSEPDAAAMIGNAMQESSMDPVAFGPGNHRGLFQLDRARQAAFARRFGYQIGSFSVDPSQQSRDQLQFQAQEASHLTALSAMRQAASLLDKTKTFMRLDEVVNDGTMGRRFAFATQALNGASRSIHNVSTVHTRIGDVNLYTPSTDPMAQANVIRDGLMSLPLLNPLAQGTTLLATRAQQ